MRIRNTCIGFYLIFFVCIRSIKTSGKTRNKNCCWCYNNWMLIFRTNTIHTFAKLDLYASKVCVYGCVHGACEWIQANLKKEWKKERNPNFQLENLLLMLIVEKFYSFFVFMRYIFGLFCFVVVWMLFVYSLFVFNSHHKYHLETFQAQHHTTSSFL